MFLWMGPYFQGQLHECVTHGQDPMLTKTLGLRATVTILKS